MRKVKVLAFVLAALMVVAAFAGCGTKQLKTDVSTLDERVTALETLLKQVSETVNGGATKDDITEILDAITANKAEAAAGDKTLADAIAKITADQATANAALKADLEKLVDAAKKDQAAGDAALQVAIEKLNNSLAATNKALEDSVKDLLEEIEDGDDDTTKALTDAINAINKAQADQAAASNKALEDAIKALQDATKAGDDAVRADLLAAIEALTKKQDEQNSAIADALAKLEETIAKNQEQAGANADLQSAINLYVGNLTVSKNDYTADSISYTAKENLEIAALHSNGIAAVQAATKVEDAKKAYDDTLAGLAKYTAKDDQLYKAVVDLKGNLTEDTKNAVADLVKLSTAVQKHYSDQGVDLKILTKYIGSDGKEINLVTEATKINTYQTTVNTYVAAKTNTGSIANLVDAISKVTGVWINQYGSGENAKPANVNTITSLKNRYDVFVDAISGRQESAKYISDSLLDLVTNVDKLNGFVEKANGLATAKAALASYGELTSTGSYISVFSEYSSLLRNSADAANWWNTVAVYDEVSARIDAWLSDYPVVDNENAHAIINNKFSTLTSAADDTYTFYADYLKNEEEANLFLDKYNYYVETILPQVTALEEIEEVTTANVQKFAEIDKAIADWKIVKPDGDDTDENPDLVITDAHFAKMLDEMYETIGTRTAAFPYDFEVATVQTFFDTKVVDAKAVAKKINDEIAALVKAEASALDTIKYRTLEGYKPVGTTGVYKMDTVTYTYDQVVAADDPTIYMFKKAFKTDKYDLTYLLETDKLEASCKVVDERIDSYEVISDKIHANLDAIEKALTFKEDTDGDGVKEDVVKLEKVSLDNEAAVMALKDDYTALTAKGYKYDTTKAWTKNTKANGDVIEGEFRNDRLMVTQDYYDITGLIMRVEELRTMATNLITFFAKVAAVDDYSALTVVNADRDGAIYKETTTTSNNTTTIKYDYIKGVNNFDDVVSLRGFDVTYEANKTSTTAAMTQADAVELAWYGYANFIEDNQGKSDAAVEVALADNGLVDLRLLVIKAKAYNAIEGVNSNSTGYKWDDNAYGDFATEQKIQLASVIAAPSVDIVADILFGFRQKTGVDYSDIMFAVDEHIFHANGHRHLTGTNVVCPDCP